MVTICIIPARYASTRFPGKPLVHLRNKPIIQHVYERAKSANLLDEVFVATDNLRIYETVESFGGKAIMTSAHHPSGTDRIAEAVEKLIQDGYNLKEDSIIINLQGDEPLIKPEMIDQLVELMKSGNEFIGTLVRLIDNIEEFNNPNVVKAVFDKNGYALYFSRSPIPYDRVRAEKCSSCYNFMYKHIGIYGYRLNILKKFVSLTPSTLEKIEKLEQLRALENGIKIKVSITQYDSIGIDTPQDLEVAEKCLSISL